MGRSRRVLMIAPTSFFADYGCHVRILEQARGLAARGHRVLICTYHSGRDVPGLEIRRTPRIPWRRRPEVGSSWHKLMLDFLLLFVVLRAALRRRPDLLHAYLHEGALIGALVGRLLRLPLAFDFQGSMTGEMLDHGFIGTRSPFLRPLRALERWIDRRPALVLANSEHSAGVLRDRFGVEPARIHLVPDCVDTERFRPPAAPGKRNAAQRRAWDVPEGALLVVYLGLLAPYQGIDLLLRACARLPAEPAMHVVIMGFPNVERYRRMAHALGLAGRVTLTGAVSYSEAHRKLALGDIAVAPKISDTEGSGKLLNYMAMGLPTVAFDTPVSREYLGEDGELVPLGDVERLAQALVRLAADAEERRRRGRRLRERAVERFGWPAAVEALEHAHDRLCGAPEAGGFDKACN